MKPITERVSYQSAKGRRPSNQDAVVVGVMADGRAVTAVADGMGGRLAGDVASRRALETMVEALGGGEELSVAIEKANIEVFRESELNQDLHGMGTTVVALVQTDDQYVIANVGDSRAYRLAADGISRMTADHSFTAEAVGRGEMTLEDAEATPWANALTRAVGTEETVEVDLFGPFDANESHMVLLCSDGFYKPLNDDGVFSSVLGCDPEEDMAAELVEVALRAGSDDNVTVAVVEFGDQGWMAEAVKNRASSSGSEDAPTMEFLRFGGAGAEGGESADPVEESESGSVATLPAPEEPEADVERDAEWFTSPEDDEADGVKAEAEGEAAGIDPTAASGREPSDLDIPVGDPHDLDPPGIGGIERKGDEETDLPSSEKKKTSSEDDETGSSAASVADLGIVDGDAANLRSAPVPSDGFRIVMPPPRDQVRRSGRSRLVRIAAFLGAVVAFIYALMTVL